MSCLFSKYLFKQVDHFEKIEQEWKKEVQQFLFLRELGYSQNETKSPHGDLREVKFTSDLFVFVVGMHYGRDGVYFRFFDAKTGKDLPSPLTALHYFLPNYKYDPNKSMYELYRENPWVLTTNDWAYNKDFLNAIEQSNQWFWSSGRTTLASQEELVENLRSFRPKKNDKT